MACKNMLFVAYKPQFISSNKFLNSLKKKYNIKKMGFSGTLDPFAKGCLIIASHQYTKLFRFLKKTPKTYIATLMLGAKSESLDIEKITNIHTVPEYTEDEIKTVLKTFIGKHKQLPPIYSAKKINGQRAYNIAQKTENDTLFLKKASEIEIYDIELLNYSHPFITFKTVVSEGTYVRTLGYDIAVRLKTQGTLTYLERISEGEFKYECEKKLNPLNYLNMTENEYLQNEQNLYLGKKLNKNDFKIQQNGIYYVKYDNYFAIIKIDEEIKYILNRIELCL